MRLPRSKKKRIQNKYIPKGIYCHGNISEVCPFWKYRRATEKDLPKIYKTEAEFLKKDGINTYEEFLSYLETLPESEKDYLLDVYECKLLHYTEYCQESLLWDQCKECRRNEDFGYEDRIDLKRRSFPLPNKIRRKSKAEQRKWIIEEYGWYFED